MDFITLLCILFVALAFVVFFPTFVNNIIAEASSPAGLYFIQDDAFTIKSSMIIIIIITITKFSNLIGSQLP